MFFAMSGYLIAMLLMREEKRFGRVAFAPFLVKRFVRIVPAYWTAILVYWLACLALGPDDYADFITRLPWFLAFLPEYANTDGYSIFTHSWTVGIELKFYLFFPPLVFLLIGNANWRFAVTALATVLLTLQGSFTAQSYCALLFGAMLAFVLERPGGYAVIARLTHVPVIVPLGLIAALLTMILYAPQFTVLALVATYLMAYCIVQHARVAPLLGWRPLVWLGQRSYGAYLLHFLAIRIGYLFFGNDSTTGGLLTAVFCLALTAPAAALMYRLVEEPAVEYGRHLVKRMGPGR
jgi:peptidoglycan/LPS O-acetylase OafA/YrhL